MSVYKESGLKVDLTKLQHFRFTDLSTYTKLKGCSLKEVDFTFFEEQILYFLEIKDFETALKHQPIAQIVEEQLTDLPNLLVKKVQDTLLLMSAIWLDIGNGSNLKLEIDEAFHRVKPFKLVIALHLPQPLDGHLGLIQTQVNEKVLGYSRLFSCGIVIVSYETLCDRFPFITPKD
jgi:hypothetical protein